MGFPAIAMRRRNRVCDIMAAGGLAALARQRSGRRARFVKILVRRGDGVSGKQPQGMVAFGSKQSIENPSRRGAGQIDVPVRVTRDERPL
jgi:hypothetical protein